MLRAASRPALPGCRSKTQPATRPTRSTISIPPSPAGFIRGRPDLDETIRRLKAFADAGADCLYSPGIKTPEQIEATVDAVDPKPINFLNSGAFGFTVKGLAALGVRRISVGGTLARVAMDAFIKSARTIANDGKFDSFGGIMTNAELNKFFGDDRKMWS